jgi:guanylate kinase
MTIAAVRHPLVFIVSGPSGSGKSTLVAKMLEVPGTMLSISSTTRPPRTTESPGKWYDFISEEEFDRRASQGEFLEYARVFGKHWYGTPRRSLEEARCKGLDLVLEIDVQGAEQVKKEFTNAVAIFILTPAREEL